MYTEEQLKEACKKAFEQGVSTESSESALYYGPDCGINFTEEQIEEEKACIVKFEDWFTTIDKEYLISKQPEEEYE